MTISVYLENYGTKSFELIPAPLQAKPGCQQYVPEQNNWIRGHVHTEQIQDSTIISLHLECIPDPYNYIRAFHSHKALTLKITSSDFVHTPLSKGIGIQKNNPFWTSPVFFNSHTCKTFENLQHILTDNGNDLYTHYMPLAGSYGITDMEILTETQTMQLCFHPYYGGTTIIDAPLAIISTASNPYQAVENSFRLAWEQQLILTPPKSLKQYPTQLKGLGWCTWNAFYHDVTADDIKLKLEEFKEKNIPIKWIIIDDGWSQTKDFKLVSFFEDLNKFPQGLKSFIQDIKSNYSIEYVGVWHAFTGYWFGLSPDFYQNNPEYSSHFTMTPSNLLLPETTEEDAYNFFSQWHHYLKEQGVDFLKVDAQGNALEFLKHSPKCCEKIQFLHNALEKSVSENFDNCLINCMGLNNLNMYSRKNTSIVRNSDDFFPDKQDGFTSHILQNAYNSIFNSQLYYCDFDMWWSKHFSAKQSCILRAISGGPIYISDKVGETEAEYLLPLIDEYGNIKRPDDAAKPTADCIFTDPTNSVLKLYNRFKSFYMLAIFNLSDIEQDVSFCLKDMFIDTSDETQSYRAHFYFAQKDVIMNKNETTFSLVAKDVEVITLY